MIILKKILMIGIMMTSKDDDNDSDSDDDENNDSDNSDDDNSDGDRCDDGYHKDESGQCERVVIIRQSKEVQTVTTGVRMANVKQQKIRLQD